MAGPAAKLNTRSEEVAAAVAAVGVWTVVDEQVMETALLEAKVDGRERFLGNAAIWAEAGLRWWRGLLVAVAADMAMVFISFYFLWRCMNSFQF